MSKPVIYWLGGCIALLAVSWAVYFLYFQSNPLVGTWELRFSDGEAGSLMNSNLGNLDQKNDKGAPNYVSDYHIRIQFSSDGRFLTQTQMPMGGTTYPGTWKAIASTDNRPTEIECDYKGDEIRIDIRWVDDDTIEMIPPNFIAFKDSYTGPKTFQRAEDQ